MKRTQIYLALAITLALGLYCTPPKHEMCGPVRPGGPVYCHCV